MSANTISHTTLYTIAGFLLLSAVVHAIPGAVYSWPPHLLIMHVAAGGALAMLGWRAETKRHRAERLRDTDAALCAGLDELLQRK